MNAIPIRKRVNAFIPDATPSNWMPVEALSAIARFKRKHGGLWVGGTISVSERGIAFTPNRVNRAVHEGLESIHVLAEDIRAVRREFGWVTGIVVIEHTQGELRFRCYGAKEFAAAIVAMLDLDSEAPT